MGVASGIDKNEGPPFNMRNPSVLNSARQSS
jgi:hypothetical protein